MSQTTKRVIVLLCALALIIPMGLVGIGQLGGKGDQEVAGAARDVRSAVDPASQPKPTNTEAPQTSSFEGMNEPTEGGARATADYLFAVYAYMIGTGDTKQWEHMSAPECTECLAFAAQSKALHQQGGWIVGGDITLNDPDVTLGTVGEDAAKRAASDAGGADDANGFDADAIAGQKSALITSGFTEAKATLVDDPKREAQTRSESTGTFTLSLRHDGKRWLVTSMVVE